MSTLKINTIEPLTGNTISITGNSTLSGSISGSFEGSGNNLTNVVTSQSINSNTSSGSLAFWQGSLAEYNLISASADNNTVYFVVE